MQLRAVTLQLTTGTHNHILPRRIGDTLALQLGTFITYFSRVQLVIASHEEIVYPIDRERKNRFSSPSMWRELFSTNFFPYN